MYLKNAELILKSESNTNANILNHFKRVIN